MDLSKYEKINGREALTKLAADERIYNGYGSYFFLDRDGLRAYDVFMDETIKSQYRVDDFVNHEWYIAKPFDIRQAMRDKPDEWVGVYQENDGSLYKVGFDTNRFLAVETELESEASVAYDFPNVRGTYPEDLERCISIEDASVNVNK